MPPTTPIAATTATQTPKPVQDDWPAWTDTPALVAAQSRTGPERRVLEAIERARLELGRRPRLAEIRARVVGREKHLTARVLDRLIARGRVEPGIMDPTSFRDVLEWRKGVPRC